MDKWISFVKERFKPFEYLPLIFLFVGVNYLFVTRLTGTPSALKDILLVGIMTFSFFFRMRLFDEIKDYEVDLVINPTRPLARGLLTIREVKFAILVLIGLELVLASTFGFNLALVYSGAVFYSLMMYEEFFIGDFLRPHLTTYAATHTIVVSFLSYAIICLISKEVLPLSGGTGWFLLSHWLIFNLFEFARKTFSASEERENVPSYSKIFTLKGAYVLSISQVALSAVCLSTAFPNDLIWPINTLCSAYLLLVLLHCSKLAIFNAKSFRTISTLYMGIHFITLFILLWRY